MAFRLGDDGTMDTVIVCTDCGAEIRFNADETIHNDDCVNMAGTCGCYDAFIEQCIEDCENDHECEVADNANV